MQETGSPASSGVDDVLLDLGYLDEENEPEDSVLWESDKPEPEPPGTLFECGKKTSEMFVFVFLALIGGALMVVGAYLNNQDLLDAGATLIGLGGVAFTTSRTITKFSQAMALRK